MRRKRAGRLRPIVLNEDLDEGVLDLLRAQLGLSPDGRLDDSEDVSFGYRCLRESVDGSVWLELLRIEDSRFYPDHCPWRFELSYTGERPLAETIDPWRSQILQVIKNVGLSVRKMRHW